MNLPGIRRVGHGSVLCPARIAAGGASFRRGAAVHVPNVRAVRTSDKGVESMSNSSPSLFGGMVRALVLRTGACACC